MATNKILIVDDESTILQLYRLELNGEFDLVTAESGEEALVLLAEHGPCAVLVADMHMPGMNGTELLRRVHESHKETIRMMLTSDDQQAIAIEAVNESQIFHFLNKPCPAERLAEAIREGLTQYRLVRAEKELLANTLNGSVNLLIDVLSIVNPLAFGRATRIRSLVLELCNRLQIENSWEVSVAAMLSQIGCVALPDCVLEKTQRGEKLTAAEAKLYASHPQLGHDLVSKIPRLGRIADIIAMQLATYDAENLAGDSPDKLDIARRASFLGVALDYDTFLAQGLRPEGAVRAVSIHCRYEPRVLEALAEIVKDEHKRGERAVSVGELRPGMVLTEDIVNSAGDVLITKGYEITDWLLDRLRRQKGLGHSICEPIRVSQAEQMPAAKESSSVEESSLVAMV